MIEKIEIPVYWSEIKGKKVIDEESMQEEFEEKLSEVLDGN